MDRRIRTEKIIKWITAFIFAVSLFMPQYVALAQSKYTYTYEHVLTIRVAWNGVPNTVYYQIKRIGIKADGTLVDFPEFDVQAPATESDVLIDHTGRHKILIRACTSGGCSDWADSTNINDAIKDGIATPWDIFWKVAKPPIIIE